MRVLSKFSIGDYIHDVRRGNLGVIEGGTNDTRLIIKWATGELERTDLHPVSKGACKELKRKLDSYRKLQRKDFSIDLNGNLARIRKVLDLQDYTDLVLDIIPTPGVSLDLENKKRFADIMSFYLELPTGTICEFQMKRMEYLISALFRVFH